MANKDHTNQINVQEIGGLTLIIGMNNVGGVASGGAGRRSAQADLQ